MEIFKNNKKNDVSSDYFIAKKIEFEQNEDPIGYLIKSGKKYFGEGCKILYVEHEKKKINKDTDSVFYIRLWSGESISKNDPNVRFVAGSVLALMWIDNNLKDIPEKIQKFLNKIPWDEHAGNIYS
jgi:hypothetical protein